MKEDQDFMDDIAQELQYDMLIADMQESLLPKFTYGQLDALRHACEVEIRERFGEDSYVDLFATTPISNGH